MAIKKKGIWDISIEINGKQIKNNLREVGRSVGKLKGQLSLLTPGTDEFIKKAAELKKAKAHFKKLKDAIHGTTSGVEKMKKSTTNLKSLILSAFSIGAVISFFKTIVSQVGVLRKLKGTLSQITKLQGVSLNQATAKLKALATTFNADTDKMSEAANNFSKSMGIGFSEALDLIKEGYLEGADANNDFLDKVKEYPVLLKETGFAAEEAIALMTQEVKLGIYSDKGIDSIKEANIRLREMPDSAAEALDAIGLSSETILKELKNGSKTTFDVIQQVSKRMATLPPQSKVVGEAIANIFGGAGEDAGLRYISNLHKIDLSLGNLSAKTNDYVRAKKLEADANEALNNVMIRLTGTGSSLSMVFSAFKMVSADLLGTLTGVKDSSLESIKSFDAQAKAVNDLDKNLVPLISEYDNLTAKTSLTKEEQDRLKVVIGKIGGIVPTAITAFDDYGNALDINSEKAKDFIKTQKILLNHKNKDVIEEQKDKLAELNKELEKNKAILKNRNKDNDVVRVKHTITKTDRLIVSEEKVSEDEIRKRQARLEEIQEELVKHQVILDAHNGDYLDKLSKKEEDATVKTAAEISARKILEATAAKLKIKNIASLKDQELKKKIEAQIKKSKKLYESKIKSDKKLKDSLLKSQQKYKDEVLFASKSLMEQEKITYEENLKSAGLYGKKEIELSKDDLKVKEILLKLHQVNMAKLKAGEADKNIAAISKNYASEKRIRQKVFNNFLNGVVEFEAAKALLKDSLSKEQLTKITTLEEAKSALKRQHEQAELTKKAKYLEKLIKVLSVEVTQASLSDSVLTDDEKEALTERLEEVKLKLSEVGLAKKEIAGGEEDKKEEKEAEDSGLDILGSSPEQWEDVFGKLDTSAKKMGALVGVLKGLQEAWGMYNKFVSQAEDKQLQKLEQSNNKKKKALKEQLDSGAISQETYNEKIEELDLKLDKKKAEIEYKRAKRERISALFNVASNTASGIMKAVASFPLTGGMPWAGIIAGMGAIQAGMILSAPMPDKGFFKGGNTGDQAIAYDGDGKITGYVHANEWVMPEIMTSNPKYAKTLSYLEAERGRLTGYYNGGNTSSSTSSSDEIEEEAVNVPGTSSVVNSQLVSVLTSLNTTLIKGIKANIKFGYSEAEDLTELLSEIESATNNGIIQA
ncbi:phage tail tape measure protein [Tenacibaculum ovolyticum]|uniref:phage tail tape measure protein n=1 Tax=Tenacibaculum ovolyticum TaxID=104270 RepID=UPI0007ED661F|nr:phage tail tape measure protein [Tenacibaculum ovolyticum]